MIAKEFIENNQLWSRSDPMKMGFSGDSASVRGCVGVKDVSGMFARDQEN